jgi:hypothetical protein
MKHITVVFILAVMALFLSCSNSSPVVPDQPAPVDISVLCDGRNAQAVIYGTDMTVAQLKCYFTKNIVMATFPVPKYWPWVCPIFKGVIYSQSDAEVLSWVYKMEHDPKHPTDCPTAAQAAAGGWLTPLC